MFLGDTWTVQRWLESRVTKISPNKSRAAAAWLLKCSSCDPEHAVYMPHAFAFRVVLVISYLLWSSTKHDLLWCIFNQFDEEAYTFCQVIAYRTSYCRYHRNLFTLVSQDYRVSRSPYINVQKESMAGLFIAAAHRRNAYLLRWVWPEGNPLKGEITCSNPSSARMYIVLRQLYLCVRLQCH